MRINKYIAERSSLSRRAADEAIKQNRVLINGVLPTSGQQVQPNDIVTLDSAPLTESSEKISILFHKPIDYVCSRDGQGSTTIYDLLPEELHNLNPVGRLDKDSSGLLLLTNDGELHNKLSHPKFQKEKVYHIALHKPLLPEDQHKISVVGIDIGDERPSKFPVRQIASKKHKSAYEVTLSEGRNRQIRRTFRALGYFVNHLHRTTFADYKIGTLEAGKFKKI